MIREKKMER